MLTDTFTAQAFFVDFTSDPTRALRWNSLRQDSGDPFAFVKSAKEAWKEVEDKQGVSREDGIVAKGKRIIFSDGLDVERAIALQKGCDDLGIGGKLIVEYTTNTSFIWDWHVLVERFSKGLKTGYRFETLEYSDQAEQDKREELREAIRRCRKGWSSEV